MGKQLLRELKNMKKDERMAPGDYEKIKKKLKSPSDKRIIAGIQRQERAHYKKVSKMLRKY